MEKLVKIGVGAGVNTLPGYSRSLFVCYLVKFPVVNLGHIRKTGPKSLVVQASQGINSHAIQMIGDQHQAAGRHIEVEAAGSVGEDQVLYTQQPERPDWQYDLRHLIAFVIVKSPLLNG